MVQTSIIVVTIVLGIIGFAFSIRSELKYRERKRKEQEEIRNIKRY